MLRAVLSHYCFNACKSRNCSNFRKKSLHLQFLGSSKIPYKKIFNEEIIVAHFPPGELPLGSPHPGFYISKFPFKKLPPNHSLRNVWEGKFMVGNFIGGNSPGGNCQVGFFWVGLFWERIFRNLSYCKFDKN